MNQPSAEDDSMNYKRLRDVFYGGLVTMKPSEIDQTADLLISEVRKFIPHLIDKTEPVSWSVTADEIRAMVLGTGRESTILEGCQKLIDSLDIAPKGTVARLQAEVERLQSELDKSILDWGDAVTKAEKLEDEVDRLKGVISKWEDLHMAKLEAKKPESVGCGRALYDREWGGLRYCGKDVTCSDCQAKQKTEAVGCGKPFTGRYGVVYCGSQSICPDCQAKQKTEAVGCGDKAYPGTFSAILCGEFGHLCPDCQAKATKKVSLPEVPDAFDSEQWKYKAESFMWAVKQWIEAQGEKN